MTIDTGHGTPRPSRESHRGSSGWDIVATCPRGCGYTTPPTTSALAQRGLDLHSCDRHRAKAKRAERHRRRMAAVDRTPKPCMHPEAEHQHGTYVAYVSDACRCSPCSAAAVSYERTRLRRIAYGTWQPLTDAEPVRAHVRDLMSQGMGLKRIMAATGTSGGTMVKLMYGANGKPPSRQVRRATADRILAVTLDVAGGVGVDATSTWMRVRGLVALGYSQAWIAEQIGQHRALQLGESRVLKAHADALRRIADRYGATPGPNLRARNRAIAHGWTPDLIWQADEHDERRASPDLSIVEMPCTQDDDHLCTVDPVVVERLTNGLHVPGARIAERAEAVRLLESRGVTVTEIGRRLHMSGGRVAQIVGTNVVPPTDSAANNDRQEASA